MGQFRRAFCIALAGLGLLPVSALADAGGSESYCGGDAYSFAEVVPAGGGRRGPIIAAPTTLCADLVTSPATRIDSLNIYVDPRRPAEEQKAPSQPQPPNGFPAKQAPFRRY